MAQNKMKFVRQHLMQTPRTKFHRNPFCISGRKDLTSCSSYRCDLGNESYKYLRQSYTKRNGLYIALSAGEVRALTITIYIFHTYESKNGDRERERERERGRADRQK